jgi:hypothetical protein
MAIPETEADIELTGLKVDDLVNSIRSRTKIVFLDACRDNHLVKGRGAYPKGLAPAVGSNFQQTNPGGGVFIAYATGSGSVALDGQGEHSPFTQALLRNLDKPISIDDMFVLVTKEVRLVTKNAQRPYKYASLENIVCLTGSCSTLSAPSDADAIQQAEHSEAEDVQIALQTNEPEALDAYLEKYPDSSRRQEILSKIASLKRQQFSEWTVFEVTNSHFPHYFQISSIRSIGTKVAVRVKDQIDPSSLAGTPFSPDSDYGVQTVVHDCKEPRSAIAEGYVFNKTDKVIKHYKWADPEYLDVSGGVEIKPGTAAHTLWILMCNEEYQTPVVTKNQLASMNFTSLSSTVQGDGEIFYVQVPKSGDTSEQVKEVIVIFKMDNDTLYKFPPNVSVDNFPEYRTEIDVDLLRCDKNSFSTRRVEYYDSSNNLFYTSAVDPSKELIWHDFVEHSPYTTLQRIICKPKEAQQ